MKPWIDYAIRRTPEDAKTFLDVGIGHGEPAANLIFSRNPKKIVGIEYFKPYADRLKRIYDEIILGDANAILPTLKTKSFDVVLGLEVIEHNTQEQALKMLDEFERIGRFVVVSSPNRFYRGHEADGNVKQLHESLIKASEVKRRGYTVRGQDFSENALVWKFTRLVPELNAAWVAWKACP